MKRALLEAVVHRQAKAARCPIEEVRAVVDVQHVGRDQRDFVLQPRLRKSFHHVGHHDVVPGNADNEFASHHAEDVADGMNQVPLVADEPDVRRISALPQACLDDLGRAIR